MKLVTSIVGLEKLGPTYRGRTELRAQLHRHPAESSEMGAGSRELEMPKQVLG